jgi:hypothetical protein
MKPTSLTELALLDGRRPLPLGDIIGLTLYIYIHKGKGESIPVQDLEAHRIVGRPGSHISSASRLTDVGEVASLMPRLPFTPRKVSGTHFC